MRQASVILENSTGVVDHKTITLRQVSDDTDEQLNLAFHAVIECWILSPGDIIRFCDGV